MATQKSRLKVGDKVGFRYGSVRGTVVEVADETPSGTLKPVEGGGYFILVRVTGRPGEESEDLWVRAENWTHLTSHPTRSPPPWARGK
jgi:hypothetical protein